MTSHAAAKKPAADSHRDWHKADIKAALEKAGWTLSRLAASHKQTRQALALALARPSRAAERRIAAALGVEPSQIWPSRYTADGEPLRTSRNRKSAPSARAT